MADQKNALPPQLQEQLLQQLHDVQAPSEVSWWPLAYSWWALIAALTIGLLFLVRWQLRRKKNNLYRKLATAELENALALWQDDKDPARYLQTANNILTRCVQHIEEQRALSTNSKTSLSGEPWLTALNDIGTEPLSSECQLALGQLSYSEKPACNIANIHAEISSWLHTHKSKAGQEAQDA